MKLAFHSISSSRFWAVLAIAVVLTSSGCANWVASNLGPESMRRRFDSLRDTRAVEMDERLSHDPLPVTNPFTAQSVEAEAELTE